MQAKHWLLLAGFLGAVGVQLAGLEHGWLDARSPAFVGGLLAQLGAMVGALYTDAPAKKEGQ